LLLAPGSLAAAGPPSPSLPPFWSTMPHEVGDFVLDTQSELGSGGYGKVVTAKNKSTGELVACKIISSSRMKTTAIQKEVDMMKKLQHPSIVGLRAHIADGKYQYIFMELATGGELFSRVISSGSLQEHEAAPYFKQLIEAVAYMHSMGVVHRDLKLENVLMDARDSCKVCDFGLAHDYLRDGGKLEENRQTLLREVCGSKSYCAPEVLAGLGYDGMPTDVWSCGICLFAMLAGFFPLDEASGSDWRFERVKMTAAAGQSVTHAIFGFYDRPCMLSKVVTDLIDGMLAIDPQRRLTVSEILSNPWLGMKPAPEGTYNTYRGMQNFNGDADALRNLLAQESDTPMQPLYRGGAYGSAPEPPPMLGKQFGASMLKAPPA